MLRDFKNWKSRCFNLKKNNCWRKLLSLALLCGALLCGGAFNKESAQALVGGATLPQTATPSPPLDRASIYFLDKNGALAPFSFEAGATPLKSDAVAKSDRVSYAEIKGEHAAISIAGQDPRFYLFVPDTPNVHPPFLIRLSGKRGARRAVVTTARGERGFAYESGQIVKPLYRVLTRDGGMFFMEVRPRELLLTSGEYAFIGANLARVATFRVD
jgi:hypothetical protein